MRKEADLTEFVMMLKGFKRITQLKIKTWLDLLSRTKGEVICCQFMVKCFVTTAFALLGELARQAKFINKITFWLVRRDRTGWFLTPGSPLVLFFVLIVPCSLNVVSTALTCLRRVIFLRILSIRGTRLHAIILHRFLKALIMHKIVFIRYVNEISCSIYLNA